MDATADIEVNNVGVNVTGEVNSADQSESGLINAVDSAGGQTQATKPTRYSNKNGKSIIWNYFEVYHDKNLRHLAYCILCHEDINYTKSKSTGMPTRHMRRKHRKDYELMIEEEVKKENDFEQLKLGRPSISTNIHGCGKTQSSMQSFIKVPPSFENKLLDWT